MRLLTRTVYRAFPELDHFSDEQCTQLVRAAAGGSFKRTSLQVLRLALTLSAAIGFDFAVRWGADASGLRQWMQSSFGDSALRVVFNSLGALFCADFILGGFVWLVARDVLLRLVVRRAMRLSGTCPTCRYALTGLAVLDGDIITCPECGCQLSIAEHGGECLLGTDGVKRFMPSPGVFLRGPSRWTSARRRRALRWSVGLAAAVLIVAALIPLAKDGFTRYQASQVRGDQLSAAQFQDLLATIRPKGVASDAENAWEILPELRKSLLAMAEQIAGRGMTECCV